MTPYKTVTFRRWHVVASFGAVTLAFTGSLIWLAIVAMGGQQAHDALCTLRQDLQRRVAASQKFVDEHPEGFAGISAAVIEKSIRDQQRTIDALRPLHCPDAVPLP